jgi:hypothetical protein
LFQARHELRGDRATVHRGLVLETEVLAPTVPGWSRHDRGQVVNILKKDARLSPFRVLRGLRSGETSPQRRQKNLSRKFRRWCRRKAGAASPGAATPGAQAATGRQSAGARIFGRRQPGSR